MEPKAHENQGPQHTANNTHGTPTTSQGGSSNHAPLRQSLREMDYESGRRALSPREDHGGGAQHSASTAATSHGAEHGDGGHENAEHPPKKNKAVIDLSQSITPSVIASALDTVANEPGEKGEIKFEIRALGKGGTGIVNARLEGWAELALQYMVNDENFHVLAVDVEGALNAGVDIAGFFHAGVEFGAGRDFLNQWYPSSVGAATWICNQLAKLNDVAGGGLLKVAEGSGGADASHGGGHGGGGEHGGGHGGGDEHGGGDPNAPSFSVHDREVFLGANVGADFGAVKGDASYRRTKMHREYHDAHHNVIPSTEDHSEVDLDLQVKAGRFNFGANYHRDLSNTVGSPIYYANGIFNHHTITLSAGLSALKHLGKGRHIETIPADGVQELVLNTFATLESAAVKFPWANRLNQKLFDHIVKEMYKGIHAGAEVQGNITFKVIFNWNEFGETSGDLNLMYFRTKVELEAGADVGGTTRAGGAEAGVSVSKSEVVYESIGSETISYVQRQFVYQTEDRPWEAFKQQNDASLRQLVQNCATKGFHYYYPEVDAAYHGGPGGTESYEAGMAALEEVWSREDAKLREITPDAAQLGAHLHKATSFFTWSSNTKRREMAEVFDILLKYYADPHILAYFLDQLPNYAVDMEELKELAEETGYGTLYQRMLDKADSV